MKVICIDFITILRLMTNRDASYLLIGHGFYSSYSYTSNEKVLPDQRFYVELFLLLWESEVDLKLNHKPRSVITEFTLFHPQSRLYSSLEFMVKFSALSSARSTILIDSTNINSQEPLFIYLLKQENLILIDIAIFFLPKSAVDLYKNKE